MKQLKFRRVFPAQPALKKAKKEPNPIWVWTWSWGPLAPRLRLTMPLAPPRLPLHLNVCGEERRWLRSKHFREELDIDWASLEQKLLVRRPTRLTREGLWQQLFCRRQQGQRWLERAYEGNNRQGTSGYPCNHWWLWELQRPILDDNRSVNRPTDLSKEGTCFATLCQGWVTMMLARLRRVMNML